MCFSRKFRQRPKTPVYVLMQVNELNEWFWPHVTCRRMGEIVAAVITDLAAFRGAVRQEDDVTLVVVKKT